MYKIIGAVINSPNTQVEDRGEPSVLKVRPDLTVGMKNVVILGCSSKTILKTYKGLHSRQR